MLIINQSINQSINQFISRHSTEARATVRLCRINKKCLETHLKCVSRWSSSTVQWKRVPKSRSSDRETTCSSVLQVVRRNWQKLLCGWSQRARLTVWADQISEVAWLLERSLLIEQGLTSHQTHYRSYRGRFLQKKKEVTRWQSLASLKLIRCRTGSQCRLRSSGPADAERLELQTTRAKLSCTRCSLWRFRLEQLTNMWS